MSLVLVGAILFAGLAGSVPLRRLGLPSVTGYLLIGLLAGPSWLGALSEQTLVLLRPLTMFALGFVAFAVGSEFEVVLLRKNTRVLALALFQGLVTASIVVAGLSLAGVVLPVALILGALAIAASPATIFAIAREYHAHGPFVDKLLVLVGIGDVVAILFFGFILSLSRSLFRGTAAGFSIFIPPLVEVFWSIALGVFVGTALVLLTSDMRDRGELITANLASISLTVGLSLALDLSPLLSAMALGMVMSNWPGARKRVPRDMEEMAQAFLVAFFVLAGAELDVHILPRVGLAGFVYILSRALGKVTGAYLGGRLLQLPPSVSQNMGLGLFPQAGVGVGLALTVQQKFPEAGAVITTLLLASVLFYEFVGPVAARAAVERAGEIHPHPEPQRP